MFLAAPHLSAHIEFLYDGNIQRKQEKHELVNCILSYVPKRGKQRPTVVSVGASCSCIRRMLIGYVLLKITITRVSM